MGKHSVAKILVASACCAMHLGAAQAAQANMASACANEAADVTNTLQKQAQNAQTALNNVVQTPTPAATSACLQTNFGNFNMGMNLPSISSILSTAATQVTTQACAALSSAVNNTVNGAQMAFAGQINQITQLPANLGGQLANNIGGQISNVSGTLQNAAMTPINNLQAQSMNATGAVTNAVSQQTAPPTTGFFGGLMNSVKGIFN